KAVTDHFHPAALDDLGQLFQLPLVHDEIVFAEDALLEDFQVGVLGHEALKLGAAQPFGEAGRQDDRAALLDDGQGAGQALDGLVPGGVERVAGTAGDDYVERLGDRNLDHPFHKADALLPGFNHVAGPDPGDAPLAVEADVDNEVAARHLGD